MNTSDTPRTDKEEFEAMGVGCEGDPTYETFKAVEADFCRIFEKEVNALQSQLAERDAALAVCANTLALYANAKEIYHDERISDYAANVLDNISESTKQYAKVIEAARELREDHKHTGGRTITNGVCQCVVCKAVRGMKG